MAPMVLFWRKTPEICCSSSSTDIRSNLDDVCRHSTYEGSTSNLIIMSKYLTGDKDGIAEFISRFDVGSTVCLMV